MKERQLTRLLAIISFIVITLFFTGCSGDSTKNGLSASGTVEAAQTNVNAEAGGNLTDVLVEEGAWSKKVMF